FDPVFARVGKHGFVKRCAFGISLPGRATFGSGDRHGASLTCHNKVAVRLWPKEVFCTVLRDHLPRDEFPVANQMFGTHKPALRKRVAFAALHRNVAQNNQFPSWPIATPTDVCSPVANGGEAEVLVTLRNDVTDPKRSCQQSSQFACLVPTTID